MSRRVLPPLRNFPRMFLAAAAALCLIASPTAGAERLKDLASIGGVRQNQLIGYGLVVDELDRATRPPRPPSRSRASSTCSPTWA